MIEGGRRSISDRGSLRRISRTLAIPPHVLGITGSGDADFGAMLSFGASVIRLADVARHGGRAVEAVSARAGDERAAAGSWSIAR
jgi:hypothetical protein